MEGDRAVWTGHGINRTVVEDTQLREKDAQQIVKDRLLEEKDIIIASQKSELAELHMAHVNEAINSKRIVAQKDMELVNKNILLTEKEMLLAQKDSELAKKESLLVQKEALIQEQSEEIHYRNVELARRTERIQQLEQQLKELVHSRDHVIRSDDRKPFNPDHEGTSLQRSPQLELPLTLKWRQGNDMSSVMGYAAQSVVMGSRVFLGGGGSYRDRDRCSVLMYNFLRDCWSTLPRCNAYWFAMSVLNSQLVVAGGVHPSTQKPTNQVLVMQLDKWSRLYPPMNVARSNSTAVSLNNSFVVAGGIGDQGRPISSVEVFDVSSNKWCSTDPLPYARAAMQSVVVNGTWYLMGGLDDNYSRTKVVCGADICTLIQNAVPMGTEGDRPVDARVWEMILDVPFFCSTPLALGGSLFAIGGSDEGHRATAIIHLYQANARCWVRVGDLPTARHQCTCSVLPNGDVLVAGGERNPLSYLSRVDFLSVMQSSQML